MGNRDHMRPACLAQRPDGMPRICSKVRDHVGPHSWEDEAETREMLERMREIDRRNLEMAANPIIVTKPADDLDMTPGSVHSVGEPEPEPVSWWDRETGFSNRFTLILMLLPIVFSILFRFLEWAIA